MGQNMHQGGRSLGFCYAFNQHLLVKCLLMHKGNVHFIFLNYTYTVFRLNYVIRHALVCFVRVRVNLSLKPSM